MEFNKKYLKAFSEEKSEQLKKIGYKFLYTSNGVYFFEDNSSLNAKFSNTNILDDVKPSITINF